MRHTYANTRGKERERVIERGWNRQSALHKKQQEKTTTQKATGEDQYHHSQNRTFYLPMYNFSRRRQTSSTISISRYTRQVMHAVSMEGEQPGTSECTQACMLWLATEHLEECTYDIMWWINFTHHTL